MDEDIDDENDDDNLDDNQELSQDEINEDADSIRIYNKSMNL